MEGQPYETPLESSEYFSDRRRNGLLKLGRHAMFETEMARADSGEQTRQEALDRIKIISARLALAQEVQR